MTSSTGITQLKIPASAEVRSWISLEVGLFLMLLGILFIVRITNLNYNTLFVDEAIYATVGRELVQGQDLQASTSWMFGSYLYPFTAATSDRIGGLMFLRGLSAVLSTVAGLFVFLTARRLFGIRAALWALLLYGLTGSSVNVGQFATYDVMGLPFLSIAIYCIVESALTKDSQRTVWLMMLAGAFFFLSFLGKYIALIYLPTLGFVAAVMLLSQGKPLFPPMKRFAQVVLLLLAAYVLYYLEDVSQVFSGQHSTQTADRLIILQVALEELAPALLAAVAGVCFLPRQLLGIASGRQVRVTIPRLGAFWLPARPLVILTLAALLLSLLALPIYHLVGGNIRALEKHTVYALVMLAPLAGHGIQTVIRSIRNYKGRLHTAVRMAGAGITIALLVWFTNFSLDRNWGFQNSWPNFSEAIEFLRQRGLNEQDFVIASGSAIYEYYFNFDIHSSRRVWYNTWYTEYKRIVGEEAMKLAIRDRAVDYVILDDYYTPEINPVLEAELSAAAYTLAFQTTAKLSSGETIRIRIFVPPQEGASS